MKKIGFGFEKVKKMSDFKYIRANSNHFGFALIYVFYFIGHILPDEGECTKGKKKLK